MNRDRVQFWLAASLAVTVHAALLTTGLVVSERYYLAPNPPPKTEPLVTVAPATVVMKPVEPPPSDPDWQIGEKTGAGDAVSSVNAAHSAQETEAHDFDQAWTRQKPVPLPTPAIQPTDQQQSTAGDATPKRDATSFGPLTVMGLGSLAPPKQSAPDAASPNAAPQQPDPETKTNGQTEGDSKQPTPDAKPTDAKEEAAKPPEATPTQPNTAEPDPAEKGASDLDPFAQQQGVDYTRGSVEARGGREVKLKRPRIDLGFIGDATRLGGDQFAVKMKIATDKSGFPRKVDVVGSSGSQTIDDAVRLAMFDSWFGGKMPDEFEFTVRFFNR